MSRLCIDEERKQDSDWFISNAEIEEVMREVQEEKEKPSTEDLYERIDDLEFELECLRADAEDTRKKKEALHMLLQVVDLQRFEEKNRRYLRAVLDKIKHITKS